MATSEPVSKPTIEGPGPGATEQLPSWMLGDKSAKPPPEKGPPVEPEEWKQETGDARDALTSLIADGHSMLADRTRYEGFRLTDDLGNATNPRSARMLSNWKVIIRYVFKRLPVGDWPVAIAAVSLTMGYVVMFLGYQEFRKTKPGGGNEPTKVPGGVTGTVGPVTTSGTAGVGGPPLET